MEAFQNLDELDAVPASMLAAPKDKKKKLKGYFGRIVSDYNTRITGGKSR